MRRSRDTLRRAGLVGRSHTELNRPAAALCRVARTHDEHDPPVGITFHWDLSNTCMALIMVAPMGLIMLAVTWSMFKKSFDIGLRLGCPALFAGAFSFGRQAALVGNQPFLKSMIPHRSRATSVCQAADVTDPAIEERRREIVETQREAMARGKRACVATGMCREPATSGAPARVGRPDRE